jgi:hypothetical protein
VLARVGRALVHDVAEVHTVAEDAIGVALRQRVSRRRTGPPSRSATSA